METENKNQSIIFLISLLIISLTIGLFPLYPNPPWYLEPNFYTVLPAVMLLPLCVFFVPSFIAILLSISLITTYLIKQNVFFLTSSISIIIACPILFLLFSDRTSAKYRISLITLFAIQVLQFIPLLLTLFISATNFSFFQILWSLSWLLTILPPTIGMFFAPNIWDVLKNDRIKHRIWMAVLITFLSFGLMRNLAIPLGFLLLILEMPTYYGLEWWWAAEYFAFTELSYLVPYFLIMVTIAWLFMMGLGQDGWLYHRFTHLIRKRFNSIYSCCWSDIRSNYLHN